MTAYLLSGSPNPQIAERKPSSISPVVVMKNSDRMQSASIRLAVMSSSEIFLTSHISRQVRRDWNILTTRMLKRSYMGSKAQTMQDDIEEFVSQTGSLKEMANQGIFRNHSLDWLVPMEVPISIISPAAVKLLKGFHEWDEALARILTVERAGTITKAQRDEMQKGCAAAYLGFKQGLIGNNWQTPVKRKLATT